MVLLECPTMLLPGPMEAATGTRDGPDALPILASLHASLIPHPDNWSGTSNPVERRRRQNRLNQRTWRQRRREQANALPNATPADGALSLSRADTFHPSHGSAHPPAATDNAPTGGYLMLPSAIRRTRAREFAQSVHLDHLNRVLRPSRFVAVTRLNVLDAMARNAAALGFSIKGLCCDELISPFNQQGPRLPWVGDLPPSAPPSLLPTPTQRAIVHHPWIDLIPIPHLRDNVLLAVEAGLIDEDELCADLLRLDRDDRPALIVWAGSWDIQGWEASVFFLRKWGWLVSGCSELRLATNRWRERRGEKRIEF